MKTEQMKYGVRVRNKTTRMVDTTVYIPHQDAQWAHRLKLHLKGLRQDGLRYKKFRRNIKAGGVEVESIVVVAYEPEVGDG